MSAFPTTQWSLIRLTGESSAVRRAAFGELSIAYRSAILAYFRSRLGLDAAEDATQSFLSDSFEHAWWARADAAVGSFRGFLLMLLRRRVGHLREARRFDSASLDDAAEVADAAHTAEQSFDARFTLVLTARAIEGLRDVYAVRGRAPVFDALLPVLSSPPEHGRLKEVAAQLGMPANTLTIELRRLRARLRERVDEELRDLCIDEAAYQADRAALQEAIGSSG